MPSLREQITQAYQEPTEDKNAGPAAIEAYQKQNEGLRVPMRSPTGEVVTVATKDLKQALDAGAELVDQETYNKAATEAKFGGLSNAHYAMQSAAARALSFGYSDKAQLELAEKLGGPQYRTAIREQLQGIKDYYPLLSAGTEAASLGVITAATGGLGGGAAGGEGAGLLARAGMALEQGATSVLGSRGAAGAALAARTANAAVRDALWGGFQGGGEKVSDAILGDHDLTAEQVLAGATHGAAWSALLGGAFEGASGLLGSLRKPVARIAEEAAETAVSRQAGKQIEAVAEQQFGNVSKGFAKEAQAQGQVERATNWLADKVIQGNYGGTKDEAIARKIWTNADDAFKKQGEIIDEAGQKLTQDLDNFVGTMKEIDQASWGKGKVAQIQKLVNPKNVRPAIQAAEEAWKLGWGTVNELEAFATKGGDELALRKTGQIVNDFLTDLDLIAKRKDTSQTVSDLYALMDKVKRDVAPHAQGWEGTNQLIDEKFYKPLRAMLENGEIWGEKLGAAQKAINGAKSMQIDSQRLFRKELLDNISANPRDKFGDYVASPQKVASHLGALKDWRGNLRSSGVGQYMDTSEQYLKALKENYLLDTDDIRRIDKALFSIKNMRESLAETGEKVQTINQLRALKGQDRPIGMDSFLGKVPGLSYIYDYYSKPMTTLERLAYIKSNADKIENSVIGSVANFFGGKSKRPLRSSLPSKDTLLKESGQLAEMQANMEATLDKVTNHYADVTALSPTLGQAMTQTSMRAMTYLLSNRPEIVVNSSITPGKDKQLVSDKAMFEYQQRLDGIKNPMSILDDLNNGTASWIKADAVRTVYPKLWQQMQEQLMIQANEQKKEIPYAKKVQMSILLGTPFDYTMSPEFIDAIQNIKHPQPQGPGQPGQAPAQPAATAPPKRAMKGAPHAMSYATFNDKLVGGTKR